MDLPHCDDVRCPDPIDDDDRHGSSETIVAVAADGRQLAFARSHRACAQQSARYTEALAGWVAIAASCLAVGCPSALLFPAAWRHGDDGIAVAYGSRPSPEHYSGNHLERVRLAWSEWYRFFTSGDLALRAGLQRSQIPILVASGDFLHEWYRRSGAVTLEDRDELAAVLVGIALEAEAYANHVSLPFRGMVGASSAFSVGSFVRSEDRAHPLQAKAQLGTEFLPSLSRLRRWDPTGRRSRAAAMKHFVTLP